MGRIHEWEYFFTGAGPVVVQQPIQTRFEPYPLSHPRRAAGRQFEQRLIYESMSTLSTPWIWTRIEVA